MYNILRTLVHVIMLLFAYISLSFENTLSAKNLSNFYQRNFQRSSL